MSEHMPHSPFPADTPSGAAILLAEALKRLLAADDGELARRLDALLRTVQLGPAEQALMACLFGATLDELLHELRLAAPVRACRACGCTDDRGCLIAPGTTCHWVGADLCSHCAPPPAA